MTKPEELARQQIDALLQAAGWVVQDRAQINRYAALGVAVREFPLKTGYADYLLFVGGKAAGVVEAKPAGTTLSGVAEQSTAYLVGLPANIPHVQEPLPFAYESTGVETWFRDIRDPDPRSRSIFSFHRPETLLGWLAEGGTLRARLRQLPLLVTTNLRDCQVEAITGLEKSLAVGDPRALIQMATGSGKTFAAVSFVYRLIKFGGARRVLFLVDRNHLGRQTLKEFQQYVTPDDGRKFTELYNVQHLASNTLDPVCRVTISTIQRLYAMLCGKEPDEEVEETSLFELDPTSQQPKTVAYNPSLPIETFDFIVTDECHRSIYHLWRQVLEYFDAFLIGLTATPSKQTIGFFNQNLVTEYNHERAVADGVNVGYQVYRIRTQITEQGSTVEAGDWIDRRDRLTRRRRQEQLDDDLEYNSNQLDRDVVSPSQIRTIVRTFRDRLFTDIFPGRTEVPKTLIFAKDDSHAEDIVHIVREEFGKGNDFCKKITYKTTGEKPEELIASFRNSYNPRIAVTVDMISTGTDIRPLECLVFLRDIRSQVYFEQMKGRGTRTILPTDLRAVTPDAMHKTHFIIVDAVGVCERDKTDSRPLERKPARPFEKLLEDVSWGIHDEDTLLSLAGRLARLDRRLTAEERQQVTAAAGGVPLKEIIHGLLNAVDPDRRQQKAQELYPAETPTPDQLQHAAEEMAEQACIPLSRQPDLRKRLTELHQRQEQVIDTASIDQLLDAGYAAQAQERARTLVDSFRQFIEANKDELTALQLLYSRPYALRQVTFEQIKALADAVKRPPYSLDPDELWHAYEQLERSRVRGAGPQKLLTNLVSLVRFALGQSEELVSFPAVVEERFQTWLGQQEQAGKRFTPEQMEWLRKIEEHVTTSLCIEMTDLQEVPFYGMGGPLRAGELFGNEGIVALLEELNEVLVA